MVLLLTGLIAFASADGRPEGGRLALLLTAMLFSQLAIGWSNDYLDREVDAVHQPSKPVAAGLVDERLMPPAILVALVVSGMTGAVLGTWPFTLLAVGTVCGLAYNFGLKATRVSPIPFVVAFAVLPLFVWSALDVYRDEFLALYAIGLTLPVAAHVANVLPDIEADRGQGRMTVAVVLGRSAAITLTTACQLFPLVLTMLSQLWLDYDIAILIPALALYAFLSLAALVMYRRNSRPNDAMAFRCLALASVIFAFGWLAAV